MGSVDINSSTASAVGSTMNWPFGLFQSEAILAIREFAAMPGRERGARLKVVILHPKSSSASYAYKCQTHEHVNAGFRRCSGKTGVIYVVHVHKYRISLCVIRVLWRHRVFVHTWGDIEAVCN